MKLHLHTLKEVWSKNVQHKFYFSRSVFLDYILYFLQAFSKDFGRIDARQRGL